MGSWSIFKRKLAHKWMLKCALRFFIWSPVCIVALFCQWLTPPNTYAPVGSGKNLNIEFKKLCFSCVIHIFKWLTSFKPFQYCFLKENKLIEIVERNQNMFLNLWAYSDQNIKLGKRLTNVMWSHIIARVASFGLSIKPRILQSSYFW